MRATSAVNLHSSSEKVEACVARQMSPKLVTLNDVERRNGPYFVLLHRIRVRCRRKTLLLGLPQFQSILLILYDHINTICAIIQGLFGQNKKRQ